MLALFGSVALFYLIFILRDLSKATENVRETTEKVNEYIISPIKVASAVIDKAKPFYDSFMAKKEEVVRKAKKSKN